MLDLNIDVFPEDPTYNGARTTSATELSGSSTSSVVNVDDGSATVVAGDGDRDSENSTSALNFDIFRKLRTTAQVVPDDDDDEEEVAGNGGRPKYVTWQLFPVTADSGGGGGGTLGCEPEFRVDSPETKWLNLSVPGSGGSEHSGLRIPPAQQQVRRSRRGPRSRSSQYRGVTFYRRTGRWESHIWDCGKQVYLGGFDTAYAAARAYDRAAIKFRGVDADINFSISDYDEDMKQMKNLSKEEFVQILRRQSTGFSRGSSRYRGVNLHKNGQYIGNKAYDKAAIECNGTFNGGIAHDLDLNLGISTSHDGSKANKNVGVVHPRPAFYHPIDGNRTMLGGSHYPPPTGLALRGQPLASNQSAIWQGAPGVPAIHADQRATQEKQAGSTGRLSSWAWNMQGAVGNRGGANQVVPLFSTTSAASSRFSF